MAKLLTERTKEEMRLISEYVNKNIEGKKYGGEQFKRTNISIIMEDNKDYYKLDMYLTTQIPIVLFGEDKETLLLQFDGFVKGIS